MTQKSYRIDPNTKSLFKGETKLLTYERYEKTGSTVKFIIAPPSVEVHADNIEGLDAPTAPAPALKPAPQGIDISNPPKRAPAKRKS